MTRPHLNLIVSQQHHLQTRWDLGLHQLTLRKGMVQSMVGVSILRPDAWLFGCCSGFLQCWRSWWGSPGAWGEHRRYLRLQEISLLIGWALGSLDPCWLRMYYIIFLKKKKHEVHPSGETLNSSSREGLLPFPLTSQVTSFSIILM